MRRTRQISDANKTPKPFEGVETIDESKAIEAVKSAVAQFLAEAPIRAALPGLLEASKQIKDGALPRTALNAYTQHKYDWWQRHYPNLVSAFEMLHAECRTDAEIDVRKLKPLEWLRQADQENWTPKEKKEHSGSIAVQEAEMDERAIEIAYLELQAKKQA